MDIKEKLKKLSFGFYFLFTVLLAYFLFFIFKQEVFFTSSSLFLEILIKIIPSFILVFVLMIFVNYFISPQFLITHFQGKGLKKWLFAITGGILSTGPIYMWYPLLADLRKKGLNNGLIACFLYNRAIKLPILPVAIFYFGGKYVLILCLVMIFASIIQGFLINKLLNNENSNSNKK